MPIIINFNYIKIIITYTKKIKILIKLLLKQYLNLK